MIKKARNGRYMRYEEIVLSLLYYHQHITKPFNIITKSDISILRNIPKSSCHDVLKNLKRKGLITISNVPEKSIFLDFLEETRLLYMKKHNLGLTDDTIEDKLIVDSYHDFDYSTPIHPTKFVKITESGIDYVDNMGKESN